MVAVAANYEAATGEVLFENYATQEQLTAAFPGYAAPLAPSVLALQNGAVSALDRTDKVYIRCGKAGVAWPTEWQDYVVALRAIVADPTSVESLPAAPAYPAGT